MPLSDDELLGIERTTTALRDYIEPEYGGVMVSKGIIDHEIGRVPELIAELRAARKVVAGYHEVRGAMSMNGPGFENSNAFWRAIEDADKALYAYDAANAESTSHPSGA